MRYGPKRLATLGLLAAVLGLLPACQQEMAQQPRYDPLEPSDFFPDGRSARPLVDDTVARGLLREDTAFYTGRRSRAVEAGQVASLVGQDSLGLVLMASAMTRYEQAIPFEVTREVIERGHERFTIYCALCHGPLGHGDGKIVERGYSRPPAFYTPRLRQAPAGYFFEVITKGYGAMPSYNEQVPPRDRWAIIAYIRVLQASHVSLSELSDEERAQLPPRKETPR